MLMSRHPCAYLPTYSTEAKNAVSESNESFVTRCVSKSLPEDMWYHVVWWIVNECFEEIIASVFRVALIYIF